MSLKSKLEENSMNNSICRKVSAFAIIVLALCVLFFSIPIKIAYAGAVEPVVPTYGLFSTSSTITKGNVTYDFSNDEQFLKGNVQVQSLYTVAPTEQSTEFIIPFVSASNKVPKFDVKVGEQVVTGEVYYGTLSNFYSNDNILELIDSTYSSEIDESVTGTLFTVFPTSNELTVSVTVPESACLIYQVSNHYTSSSRKGTITFDIHNALLRQEYCFFVVGSNGSSFSSEAEYKEEVITCKEYIDNYYELYGEYFEECNLPIEFLYSRMNSVMNSSAYCNFDDYFINSMTNYRVHTFRFNVRIEKETTIAYTTQGKIQVNTYYKPYKYAVKHIRTGSYPIDYVVNLNTENPYILESEGMEQDSTQNLYCEFSSSKEPINIIEQQKQEYEREKRRNMIICIVCGIVGGIALIGFAVSITQIILDKKRTPKR